MITLTGKHIKIGVGVVAVIILVLIVFVFNRWSARRSNFQWPVTSAYAAGATAAETTADTTFNNALNSAQDIYNQTLISLGSAPTEAQLSTAESVRAASIKSASSAYVTARCQASDGIQPSPTSPYYAFYNSYKNNISSIQQGYVPAQRQITTAEIAYINASRKADISGATRKYIASACPNFYNTDSGNPTTTYSAWAVGEGVTNGFKPSQASLVNIQNWADYAATVYTVSGYFKTGTIAANGTTAAITLTSVVGLANNDPVQIAYKTPTTVVAGVESSPVDGLVIGTIGAVVGNTITVTLPAGVNGGFVLADGALIAKPLKTGSTKWKLAGTTTTPNWKTARDFGAGSVGGVAWQTT